MSGVTQISTVDQSDKEANEPKQEAERIKSQPLRNDLVSEKEANELRQEAERIKSQPVRNDLVSEKEANELRQEAERIKSQPMRNDLIFGGIPETPKEISAATETKLRKHFVEKLDLTPDVVNSLNFESVQRLGIQDPNPAQFYSRTIVARFCSFKDREMIRKLRFKYEGTSFFMHEHFPPEVAAKRRKLVPRLERLLAEGKKACILYDTLYIDGRPVKD